MRGRRFAARISFSLLLVALAAAITGFTAAASGTAAHRAGGKPAIPVLAPADLASTVAGPLLGNGIWIWQLSHTSGGDPSAIVTQAQAHKINTVFIKSSDGVTPWQQFSPGLVQTLKAAGIHVCAWQYVYGRAPGREAALGIRAAQLGADCLIIDAEAEYEGKYSQALTYMHALRAALGPNYPLGLTSFPYVDYHPAFPYSVFLGPGGAQFNLPQMYWRAIGTSVDRVFTHTMAYNLLYGRPIFPLGQLWQNPTGGEVTRFRQLSQAFGATGVSWWDWQEASGRGWNAIARPLAAGATASPPIAFPRLRSGARGDLVVLLQQRLTAAGFPVPWGGRFGAPTVRAVRAFQRANGLPATGAVDGSTWRQLALYHAPAARWVAQPGAVAAAASDRRNGPSSAFLPAIRDELPPKSHGAG